MIRKGKREHSSDFLKAISSLLSSHKQCINDSQEWVSKHMIEIGNVDCLQFDFTTTIEEESEIKDPIPWLNQVSSNIIKIYVSIIAL